jgi:AraC family transcriptional regulator of adaptative response/methylated-DNA-[protein]-cysteine methyltransferase
MYEALQRRDTAYDGVFFVAVRTTGIFCRPTCPARKPKSTNVEYFPTPQEALQGGYRPCLRCRPMDLHATPPGWVRDAMAAVERAPADRFTDSDLRAMDLEPTRIRRYFKQHYGMTFHAYHRARRLGLALAELRAGADLTDVGLRHGFGSTSGFRDAFTRVFGTPPGGARSMPCLLARWLDTPLGPMLAVAGDDGLCLLEFVDRRALETELAFLRTRLRAAIVPGPSPFLDHIAEELEAYFDGCLQEFTVPLALHATPFQRAVWSQLRDIPYGDTTSYSAIADAVDRPGASRAVGRANGQNRMAIIIPCHRVVRADGTLCGYGGGLWRKRWLIEHERRHD